MRQCAHHDIEATVIRRAASSGTVSCQDVKRTADSIVTLQRLAGNRAVANMLQRQPQDRSVPAHAAAEQRVLGGPASTGSFSVQTVDGQNVPAPEALAY